MSMNKIYKAIMIEKKVGDQFKKLARESGLTQSEFLEKLMAEILIKKVNKK